MYCCQIAGKPAKRQPENRLSLSRKSGLVIAGKTDEGQPEKRHLIRLIRNRLIKNRLIREWRLPVRATAAMAMFC